MAEIKIKPGSLTIQVEEQGRTVELNCPWVSSVTRVILEPKGKPAQDIWRAAAPAGV